MHSPCQRSRSSGTNRQAITVEGLNIRQGNRLTPGPRPRRLESGRSNLPVHRQAMGYLKMKPRGLSPLLFSRQRVSIPSLARPGEGQAGETRQSSRRRRGRRDLLMCPPADLRSAENPNRVRRRQTMVPAFFLGLLLGEILLRERPTTRGFYTKRNASQAKQSHQSAAWAGDGISMYRCTLSMLRRYSIAYTAATPDWSHPISSHSGPASISSIRSNNILIPVLCVWRWNHLPCITHERLCVCEYIRMANHPLETLTCSFSLFFPPSISKHPFPESSVQVIRGGEALFLPILPRVPRLMMGVKRPGDTDMGKKRQDSISTHEISLASVLRSHAAPTWVARVVAILQKLSDVVPRFTVLARHRELTCSIEPLLSSSRRLRLLAVRRARGALQLAHPLERETPPPPFPFTNQPPTASLPRCLCRFRRCYRGKRSRSRTCSMNERLCTRDHLQLPTATGGNKPLFRALTASTRARSFSSSLHPGPGGWRCSPLNSLTRPTCTILYVVASINCAARPATTPQRALATWQDS
ncbi:hypothetical protein LZ30DRAFT_448615 [Colletotrichum cereale]|nr:hypothetical protein LZ30DRAFT_448615 [Colletotrichum cereale]